jgi:uncharacterized protein DUF4349
MKSIKFLIIILIAIAMGCTSSYKDEDFSDALYEDTYDTEFELANEIASSASFAGAEMDSRMQEPNLIVDKKIIKDARIGLEVENYAVYRSNLDSSIQRANGYISSDNLDKNDYNINCQLVIRIPAQNFEKFISVIEKGSDKLLYKNISARDVTEEFIDIEARLNTKKEVEKRYIQLLSRAKNIKEILEVEEKLRVIREEIESKEGRLKYLKKQVSYSTIYLHITQNYEYKYEPEKEKNFFQRLFKSLDKGWKGFIVFLLFLFRIWPVILIGVFTFYYIRKIRRKKKMLTNKK